MGEDPKVEMSVTEHGISGCRAFVSWLDFDRPIGDRRCRVIGFGRTPAEATADALTCRGIVPPDIAALILGKLPQIMREQTERAIAATSTTAASSPPDFFTAVDDLNAPATPAAEPEQAVTDAASAEGPSTDPTVIISATCVCGHPVRISAPTSVRFISCRCQKCGKPVWVRVDTALTADGDDEDAESADAAEAEDSDRDSIDQLTREVRHLNAINADLLAVNETQRAKIAALTAENAELKAAPVPAPIVTDTDRIAELEAVIADRDALIADLKATRTVSREALNKCYATERYLAADRDELIESLHKTEDRLRDVSSANARSLDAQIRAASAWHVSRFGTCPVGDIVLRAIDELVEVYAAVLARDLARNGNLGVLQEPAVFLDDLARLGYQRVVESAKESAEKHLTPIGVNPDVNRDSCVEAELADVLIVLSGVIGRFGGIETVTKRVAEKLAVNMAASSCG